MTSTPIIDMFSGTGELARAVADGLNEFTCFQSFSDNYGPARKYLKARFHNVKIHSDFRDQVVPEGSIVTIGAPCQDLSVAGKRAGTERGSGTRSSLIHEALDMAVAGGADLIIAWARVIQEFHPPLKDDWGRLNAAFVEWLMGLPSAHAVGLSRTASIRLAGNAVVRLQARLMLQRGLTAINHERNL